MIFLKSLWEQEGKLKPKKKIVRKVQATYKKSCKININVMKG